MKITRGFLFCALDVLQLFCLILKNMEFQGINYCNL